VGISATQPYLWGMIACLTPDLRLVAVPGHFAPVDGFRTSYPQKMDDKKYFSRVYYILALLIITPHIWGYLFWDYSIYFRTIGLIVHRQRQFSTVFSELSTVLGRTGRSCLNKHPQIWTFRWDISDSRMGITRECFFHSLREQGSPHLQRLSCRVRSLYELFPSPSSFRTESSYSA
jgi:hypothetical protein